MKVRLYLVALLIFIVLILAGCIQQDFAQIETQKLTTQHEFSESNKSKYPIPTQTPKNTFSTQSEPIAIEMPTSTQTQSQNTTVKTPIETPTVTPTPTPANEPPTVKIIKPKDKAVIKSHLLPAPVQIIVEVEDDKDIDRVEFYVDGELKRTTYFFHSATVYLDEGVHIIKVIAYDNEGLIDEDTVTIYIIKKSNEYTSKKPVATKNNSSISTPVVTPPSVTPTPTSSSSAPESNESSTSKIIEETIPSTTPTPELNEPPRVRIIEPRDGEIIKTRDLPAKVTIKVEASDDKGIDRVEFYVDGEFKETTYLLRSITVYLDEGSHVIHVVAYDNEGLTDEDTVTIHVEKEKVSEQSNRFVDEYEDDDSITQAKPILVGDVQHHMFDSSSDEDWLYFEASAGRKYIIEIIDSDVTVSISIYDANENILATFKDKLEWICEKDGIYYIKLSPVFLVGEGGNYSVRLTEIVIEPTPTPIIFEYGVKYKVKVLDVIDGDTIDVLLPDGRIERVRMLGIDTPENNPEDNKPYEYDSIADLNYLAEWGLKATQFTKSKLEGKYVYIEFDEIAGFRGHYGRLLAYVYLEDGTDFTAELVRLGYGRVYVEGEFKKKDYYLKLEEEAKREGRGLWSILKSKQLNKSTTSVKIIYVHYDAYGNDNYNLNDEYVVIKNVGDTPVNLEGWMLKDEAGHTFIFPSIILDPSETVTIYSGSGVNTDNKFYWNSSRAIWNNNGDTAFLYDANGNLVDSYRW